MKSGHQQVYRNHFESAEAALWRELLAKRLARPVVAHVRQHVRELGRGHGLQSGRQLFEQVKAGITQELRKQLP